MEVGCHVSAATLTQALPEEAVVHGYRIDSRTVQCWNGWAWGYDPYWVGDGVDLFHYHPGTGWRYYDGGSAFECKDLGIDKDVKDPPPFCG